MLLVTQEGGNYPCGPFPASNGAALYAAEGQPWSWPQQEQGGQRRRPRPARLETRVTPGGGVRPPAPAAALQRHILVAQEKG